MSSLSLLCVGSSVNKIYFKDVQLGRADKTISMMDRNGSYLELVLGNPTKQYGRIFHLRVTDRHDDKNPDQSFTTLTGKLAALFSLHIHCCQDETYTEAKIQANMNAINARTYEVRSNWCIPSRFLVTLLNAVPKPIVGTVRYYKDDSDAYETVKISYISGAYDKHNELMQVESKEASQNKKLYSILPFVAFSIDKYTLGQEYVVDGTHRFQSLYGRGKLLLMAVSFLVQSVTLPVMQIIWIVQNSKLWPQHHSYLSAPDAFLGITVSPVFYLANAVKCVVAAIIHPGIVFAELPTTPPVEQD